MNLGNLESRICPDTTFSYLPARSKKLHAYIFSLPWYQGMLTFLTWFMIKNEKRSHCIEKTTTVFYKKNKNNSLYASSNTLARNLTIIYSFTNRGCIFCQFQYALFVTVFP